MYSLSLIIYINCNMKHVALSSSPNCTCSSLSTSLALFHLSHAGAWGIMTVPHILYLCCLEISSGKWIAPLPLNLDLIKFLGHGQKAAIWLATISQEWLIFQLIIVLLSETLTWAKTVLNALSTTLYHASTWNQFRQLWHMPLSTAHRRQRQWIFASLKAFWSMEWVPGQIGLYSENMSQKNQQI